MCHVLKDEGYHLHEIPFIYLNKLHIYFNLDFLFTFDHISLCKLILINFVYEIGLMGPMPLGYTK